MAIECSLIENNSCLKCGKTHKKMVLIGALVMCRKCWRDEFGVEIITTFSNLYKTKYNEWLKKHKGE